MIQRGQEEIFTRNFLIYAHVANLKHAITVGGVFQKDRQRVAVGARNGVQYSNVGMLLSGDRKQYEVAVNL